MHTSRWPSPIAAWYARIAQRPAYSPLAPALDAVRRHERVLLRDLRPARREQRRHGVELHRAGAERDHGVHQRQVLVLQLLDVAHDLRLRVVRVVHVLLHEVLLARELRGHEPGLRDRRRRRAGLREGEHLVARGDGVPQHAD